MENLTKRERFFIKLLRQLNRQQRKDVLRVIQVLRAR